MKLNTKEKQIKFVFCLNICRVGIEYTQGESQNAYLAATAVKKAPVVEKKPEPVPEVQSDSDSDSN